MKIMLLTAGVVGIVIGCVIVSKGICIGVIPLGAGMYAMAESLFRK